MSKVKAGQIWKEDDNRMDRKVKVLAVKGIKVEIENVDTGRKTTASLKRFGQSKGYKLFKDVSGTTSFGHLAKTKDSVNYLMTNGSITLHYDGKTKVVAKDDERFEKVLNAIRENKLNTIPEIVEVERYFVQQGLDIVDGLIHVRGEALPFELSKRILEYKAAKLPFDSLMKFWDNLKKNPSFNSRQQLFKFLENKGHSITEDGCFIGYRGVTEDFKDIHSKTFDNKPGSVCEMSRDMVDDNPTNTCSRGLHVGGFKYAKDFAGQGKLVIVKVNPADVVAVPNDYDGQKMRVCRFEVLKEATDIVSDVVYQEESDDEEQDRFEDWGDSDDAGDNFSSGVI